MGQTEVVSELQSSGKDRGRSLAVSVFGMTDLPVRKSFG